MATPVNPFDGPAVQEWLAAKAAREQAAQTSLVAQETPATQPGEHGTPEPADMPLAQEVALMLDRWSAGGTDQFLEAMSHIMASLENMAAGITAAHEDDADLNADNMYLAAQLGKAAKDAGAGLYNAARLVLWDAVGGEPGTITTGAGRTVKFLANTPVSRSVRYKDLQSQYPDVYAAVVTETRVDPSKPGRLYL